MSRRGSLSPHLLCGVLFAAACIAPIACMAPSAWLPPPEAPLPDVRIGPAEGAAPPSAPEAAPPTGPLEMGIQKAILMALENNQGLKVERLSPAIRYTFEGEERAAFDPVVGWDLSTSRERTRSRGGSGSGLDSSTSERTSAEAWLQQYLPTGTTLNVTGSATLTGSGHSLYSDKFETSRVGLSVTQALLRGYGLDVNLASLRQARLDTLLSHYELRAFVESLLADVEETYWDYALAERQIEIYTQSLRLAEQQLSETEERIGVGKLAETELAAAQAEVALRREALINARSLLAKTRLLFLRLLNPPGLWGRQVALQMQPAVPETKLDDIEAHVQVALKMRPDLNEAKLRVRRGDLEIVKTRNGLLPKLDLFVELGKSGYSRSLGHSIGDIGGKGYDALVGLTYEFPVGNRAANARHDRAVLTARQLREAVDNLAQLAQVDVRSAYLEVERTREQVVATAATRKFKEEALRAETEKFRVGKSTSFLVAQAQRDLVASQIAEVEAVVNLLKGLVELYRTESSLLERRGVQAPGREPVSDALPPAK